MEFSFIIPIYNIEGDVINACIDSIKSQNIDESYEIILVDDGSDRNVKQVCMDIIENNSNIKYYYQENSGSAVARNLGLAKSNGKYILFVDADDQLAENFYSELKRISYSKYDFLIFDYCFWKKDSIEVFTFKNEKDFINDKNDILSNILFYPGKMNNFMFGSIWGKMFSKEYLDKYEIRFTPKLRKAQDRMFMLQVINNATNIEYCPILEYKYRINISSITHKKNDKMVDYYYELYNEIIKYCNEYHIEHEITKFLEYNIINEILPLTIFHANSNENIRVKKKKYRELTEKFNLKEALKYIKYSDVPTKKGKVKLFLFKNNFVYCIYAFYKSITKKAVKKEFNK